MTVRTRLSRFVTVVLAGAALLSSGCGKKGDDMKNNVPELPVLAVSPSKAVVTVEYAARLEGRADAEIRPQVDGVLQKILVKEGELVRPGQPLFVIDDSVYREQYRMALAARQAAEAQAAVARLEVEKIAPLVAGKVVAPVQLATARAQAEAARAASGQASASARAASISLGYTVVKAPVGGYIGRIPFRQGNLLTRNQLQALTTVSDVGTMYAVFSISENEFQRFKATYAGATIDGKIANVPPVRLTLSDGAVYEREGRLESVSGGFDRTTGSIGLRASFPNPAGLLRSGNSGRVALRSTYDGVLLVPQSATVELQDKVFVFVLGREGRVKKQVVHVDGRSDGNFIVTSGISPGDIIVTAGLDKLKDGATIKPVRQPAPVPAAQAAPSASVR